MTPEEQQQIASCVFREASDLFFIVHPVELRVVEANPSAQRITGYRRRQLVGMRLTELLEATASTEQLNEVIQACQTTSYLVAGEDFYLKTATGSVPVHVAVSRIHTEREPLGLLVVRDLSKLKRLEGELRASEEHFRRLAEKIHFIPWVADAATWQFRYVGPQTEELLGYPARDWEAAGFWRDRLHPEDRDWVLRLCEEATASQTDFDFELRMLRSDRAAAWLHAIVHVVRDDQGRPQQLQGVLVDIGRRKQAESERRRLEAQMQQAQKMESLGVLAGGIAHDFNNLLTVILGHADLARAEVPLGSPGRQHLEQVVAGARRAADLTNQMLSYAGKSVFFLRPLDLSELVRSMTELLKVSISKHARLQCKLQSSLPAVQGDPAQLRQVVMNLILNASDALGEQEGAIFVRTENRRWAGEKAAAAQYLSQELPEGDYVSLQVTDTGCGMSDDVVPRIFDPFFTTKFTGRGLGLAAVLGIIRSHQGAIQVSSAVGRGTTCEVLLPVAERAAAAGADAALEVGRWRGSGTVLVVDDEDQVRGLARAMLESLGLEVVTARGGYEAVEMYREQADRVVLVLLDLTMPGIDGVETYRLLRQVRPGVRAVLCSGYGEYEARQRMANEGLAGFVAKPYQLEDLRATLRSVLAPG